MVPEQLIDKLKEQAMLATENAYCKYSHFPVGAAVLVPSGKIYSGCNIENASFGLTICAERTAIFNAVLNGEKQIQALAIFTPTQETTPPCGACRQVLNEFGRDAVVVSFCKDTDEIRILLNELLPFAFGQCRENGD